MGYRLNRLDEPIFMAVSKPLLTEFGIHHRLESCGYDFSKSFSRIAVSREAVLNVLNSVHCVQ